MKYGAWTAIVSGDNSIDTLYRDRTKKAQYESGKNAQYCDGCLFRQKMRKEQD